MSAAFEQEQVEQVSEPPPAPDNVSDEYEESEEAEPLPAFVRRRETHFLHKAVFDNNLKTLAQLIRSGENVAQRDVHGNTPLHLAIMLGHRECTALLLTHNAPVKVKNKQGWTALAEAISYGDRPIITAVLRKLKAQSRESIHSRKPHLVTMLKKLGDFYLELRWDFHSWIPFMSSMLPSDVCKIYKKGGSIRLDTTLVDFNENNWERGDISFVFNSEASAGDTLFILDNKARVYQKVRNEESEGEVEQEVDVIMSGDIVNAQVSTKTINFTRAYTGWLFRQERSEVVGNYQADYYSVEGLYLETRKRREHLSAEDVKKNKSIIENFRLGSLANDDEWRKLQTMVRRKSLPPPTKAYVSWDDYISATPGKPTCLGRQQIIKESVKLFKAHIAMSDEFPLTIETLLDILEIIAPFKHLNKLRLFCQVKLPPGFPVKIEIPLLPTVTAKVTFQKMQFQRDISPALFVIPNSYREEAGHFPEL